MAMVISNQSIGQKHGRYSLLVRGSISNLTGVEHAYDDILAGVSAGRQPLATVKAFLEAQKLPRPRGVRGPPPLARKGRHHLCPGCRK